LNAAWGRVDRLLMGRAVAAPFVNVGQVDVFGAAMKLTGHCYTNHVVYSFDYSQACKRRESLK
jgi:hypothetical protein